MAPGTLGRRWLWVAFVAVHAWNALVGAVLLRTQSFWDLELYRFWVTDGLVHGIWPVLDTDWVYPVGALAPMLAVAPFAGSPTAYALAWAGLVTALTAGAVALLLRVTPHGEVAAWWWLAAILALGPVGMGRLEGVVAPVTVGGLALAARRPRVAAALLTAGAWVKVAPGVIVLALAATSRRVLRDVLAPAAAVSGAVVGLALLGGAGTRVVGFLTAQTARDLQIEAVAATPYSLARLATPAIWAELDLRINTFEVAGVDTSVVARVLDVALPLAVAVLTWLTWRAGRTVPGADGPTDGARDAPGGTARSGAPGNLPSEALLAGAFALSLALVVLNKVGSPQFMSWLLPPVVVALAGTGWTRTWRAPAVALLVVAALTQWLFPHAYLPFLWAAAPIVVAEAARNVLLVGLLGWAGYRLWRLG